MSSSQPGRSIALAPPPSKLLSYLRLFRLPNAFTALADVAMGSCFVQGAASPNGSLVALLLSSGSLYTSGMILNDVYDVEVDRIERPRRPLPSGAIDLGWARRLGYGLLVVGILLAWAAPWFAANESRPIAPWRSGTVGTVLAACVVLYDRFAKSTILGPFVMGSCRFFNVLLGMSIAVAATGDRSSFWGFTADQAAVALGIGVYIVGVTLFARSEAADSNRVLLVAALVVVLSGLALLALFPKLGLGRPLAIAQPAWWPAVIAILGLFIIRPAMRAVSNPEPRMVQAAIKHFIVSLITLDAAVTFAMAGLLPSLLVLALLAPMLALGKWVYST